MVAGLREMFLSDAGAKTKIWRRLISGSLIAAFRLLRGLGFLTLARSIALNVLLLLARLAGLGFALRRTLACRCRFAPVRVDLLIAEALVAHRDELRITRPGATPRLHCTYQHQR